MNLSQTGRLIRIATPLGEDTLLVLSFSGAENLSKPFLFDLRMASEKNDITFEQLAGKNVTVAIRSANGGKRFFNGIILEFSPAAVQQSGYAAEYTAVMAPAFWKLKQCHDCRIFQDLSVPDIIRQTLSPSTLGAKGIKEAIEFRMETSGAYLQREFCMQYNESDFDFISRLCEDEGLFYFFEHQNGKHTLVFADTPDIHKPHAAGANETVIFQKSLGGDLDREVITALAVQSRLTVAKYAACDYNFRTPQNPMTVTQKTLQSSACTEGECYQYPGGYRESGFAGAKRALVRMQEQDARMAVIRGVGNCRSFCPGYLFTLQAYPLKSMNGEQYLLTAVIHEAVQEIGTGGGQGDHYDNNFTCIPQKVPFRPERDTPRPVMAGNLSAIVTGPPGNEIYTDTDGHRMVKVQFFFDRRDSASRGGDMSCFIRVAQAWAGSSYGTVFIPRIGQEVIVGFADGDCDRPIITGAVYHGQNKAPHNQASEQTKSVIMTSSSPGNDGYNEICFEDRAGGEKFQTHAAKDQIQVVENDLTTTIKRHQQIDVAQNRMLNIQKDETTTINGGRGVQVQNNERHINLADFLQKVGGSYTLKVNGDLTIDVSGIARLTGAKVIIN